jgi:hypothetical protein
MAIIRPALAPAVSTVLYWRIVMFLLLEGNGKKMLNAMGFEPMQLTLPGDSDKWEAFQSLESGAITARPNVQDGGVDSYETHVVMTVFRPRLHRGFTEFDHPLARSAPCVQHPDNTLLGLA